MPARLTSQWLKENFLDKGRDVNDAARILLGTRDTVIDGDALLLIMAASDLNVAGSAWNLAYRTLHPDQDNGPASRYAHEGMDAAQTNITPEQYEWALKQAEDLGLPGQPVGNRLEQELAPLDPAPDENGFHGMGPYAAGLLHSKNPLPDAVIENAAARAAGNGSTTATEGLARRLANGQLSAQQRSKVVSKVGWSQLIGQRGAWPSGPFTDQKQVQLSPEETEQAWDQLLDAARREPTGDELKDGEARTGIENYLNTITNVPKRAYDFLIHDGLKDPQFVALRDTSSPDALREMAIRSTPHAEHHQYILDQERKNQAEYLQEHGVRAGWHTAREMAFLLRNPAIKPEFLNQVADVVPEIIPVRASGWIAQVPGLSQRLHDHAMAHNDREMAWDLIRNEVSTAEQTERLVGAFPSLRAKLVENGASWEAPDIVAEHKVKVAFGTNKLRQARDHILAQGKKELPPKLMPPGDWKVGRLPNGNISADLLQQAIDSAPRIRYNVTHGTWSGAQRHSEDESNVFQLNATADQVRQLKEAGVWDRFKKMHEASRYSGHPLGPTGIGWVRWTGGKKDGGIFIDEVQSDFGQSFVRQAAQQARDQGYDENEAAERARDEYGDESDFEKISNILFGGKHPSEALQEAFHEWLRTPHLESSDEIFANGRECPKCGKKDGMWGSNGSTAVCRERVGINDHERCETPFEPRMVDYVGVPVHIWQPESKATISLGRSDDKLPGHFYVGYRDVPQKRLGMRPGQYGELKTQKNSRHTRQVNRPGPLYVKSCVSCGEEVETATRQYDDPGMQQRQGAGCPKCGTWNDLAGSKLKGSLVEFKPAKPTWKDEVRKNEDQREVRPQHTFQEHDLPAQLRAEGYRLNIAHMPGTAIATVHQGGRTVGHVRMVDGDVKEEWKHEPRAGLRESVKRILEGHAKGEQEVDAWNEAQPGPVQLSKKEGAGTSTLKPPSAPGFHAQPTGSHVTQAHRTYAEAAAAHPKTDVTALQKNIWVRPHGAPTNEGRTLMVQFSSDLLQGNRQRDHSDTYYDNLYSKRQGYHRPDDWWEVPQWQAHIAHSLPNTDHYTVRDPEEAKRFIAAAGYKNVAFSSLDVTAPFIKDLAKAVPSQAIAVGGYTDMGMYKEHPNVTVHPSVQSFVESEGHEYRPGYDYRHFNGVKVIPRLTLSDGCRHQCTFCCVPKKVVEVPMETVRQQADAFGKDLNAELVYLNDKTFGQAENHAELPDLYQRIRAQNPNFKGFVIQTTAAQMKRMTPEFLRAAGIRHVELGIESVNDPILRAHKKPANEAIIEEAAQKIRAAGSSLIPNIMVGLPGEDEGTYGRTMEWLKKNADIISHVNAYNLALYEDSELGKTLQAVSQADRDENQQVKSWMVDPSVHKNFSEKLFQFANEQLDKPVGHVEDFQKDEVNPNAQMVGLLSTKGGNAHRTMGELVPSMMKGDVVDLARERVARTPLDQRISSLREAGRRYQEQFPGHPEEDEPPVLCSTCGFDLDDPTPQPLLRGCPKCGRPAWQPMVKTEDPHPSRAASVLVYNEHGQVLWGRRQRDGKWTLPGGHLESGEDPATGAIRELLEEAGLVPERMHHFGSANTPSGIPVYMFQAEVADQTPHARFDPDNEVSEWRWVDCLQGLPPDIASNLAHPRNVVCEHMGWTAPVAPAMMTDMAKSELMKSTRAGLDVLDRLRETAQENETPFTTSLYDQDSGPAGSGRRPPIPWHEPGHDDAGAPDEWFRSFRTAPITMNFPAKAIPGMLRSKMMVNAEDKATKQMQREADAWDDRERDIAENGWDPDEHGDPVLEAFVKPYLSRRREWEEKVLGIPADASGAVRPVYGALHYQYQDPEAGPHGAAPDFGELFMKLKPDVRQRSSFTSGDSFGNDKSRVFLDDTIHHVASIHYPLHQDSGGRRAPYVEAQIHGGVSLGNDVESVHVTPTVPAEDAKTRASAVRLGKQFNLPVYHHHKTGEVEQLHAPAITRRTEMPRVGGPRGYSTNVWE